jgi:hypothetical protein
LSARRVLSVVAGVSLVYDLSAGLLLLAATDSMARWFGVPLPNPVIFAKLNGLFLCAVGIGYVLPLFNPVRYRAYLWIFGPLLKGAGAITFIVDHFVNASPASFLLFAVTDGALAVATVAALMRRDAITPSGLPTPGKRSTAANPPG